MTDTSVKQPSTADHSSSTVCHCRVPPELPDTIQPSFSAVTLGAPGRPEQTALTVLATIRCCRMLRTGPRTGSATVVLPQAPHMSAPFPLRHHVAGVGPQRLPHKQVSARIAGQQQGGRGHLRRRAEAAERKLGALGGLPAFRDRRASQREDRDNSSSDGRFSTEWCASASSSRTGSA